MLSVVTGWPFTADELGTVAKRVVNARKCLNQREGWTAGEDTLPSRLLTESPPRPGCPIPVKIASADDDRRLLPGARMDRAGPGPRASARGAGSRGSGLRVGIRWGPCSTQITSRIGSRSSSRAIGRPPRSATVVPGSMPRLW